MKEKKRTRHSVSKTVVGCLVTQPAQFFPLSRLYDCKEYLNKVRPKKGRESPLIEIDKRFRESIPRAAAFCCCVGFWMTNLSNAAKVPNHVSNGAAKVSSRSK